jgi:hypothetical protein
MKLVRDEVRAPVLFRRRCLRSVNKFATSHCWYAAVGGRPSGPVLPKFEKLGQLKGDVLGMPVLSKMAAELDVQQEAKVNWRSNLL